jgi:signal transduction histidine kinase
MNSEYQYRKLGQAFYQELSELLSQGQSMVLLGPSHIGKRYAIKILSEQLANNETVILVKLEFSRRPALTESSMVCDVIEEAVRHAVPDYSLPREDGGDLLAPLRHLCDVQHRSIILMATNLDSLAHHLAQRILRETRVLVGTKRLTALLTGEESLSLLVYGPGSEFDCTHQFVVQAFDEAEFINYMNQRGELLAISFLDPPSSLRHLCTDSGGNILLARAVLWAWQDMCSRGQNRSHCPVAVDAFTAFLNRFPLSDGCGTNVFYDVVRMVERAPHVWRDLEALIRDALVNIPLGTQPHSLELAGIAIRSDGRLRFASPIMRRFVTSYYDDCRFGDLYAIRGDWERAFLYYARMPQERCLRPGGADDRTRLALVIKALEAQLHSEATKIDDSDTTLDKLEEKLRRLKDVFVGGCRLVLGVSEVTFWSHVVTWEPHKGQGINPTVKKMSESILNEANLDSFRAQQVSGIFSKICAVAIMPSIRPDGRDAVVVFDSTEAISKERREFMHELLEQFASAYDHCIAHLGVMLRLKARKDHLSIATAIVNALGETVRNPREALRLAGQELLKLGYRRVMFAQVDPSGKEIRGISDCIGEECAANVADATKYPLEKPEVDIQPWVVVNKKACVVKDWRTWNERKRIGPPMNRDLCIRANTRLNFAVVPMFIRNWRVGAIGEDQVYGTIHVEREDGLPPSKEDIEDLIEFGWQIAAVANQSERVYALLTSLNCDQDLVAIFDRECYVRFANNQASQYLELPEGWHDAAARIRLSEDRHTSLAQWTNIVTATNRPKVVYDTSSGAAEVKRRAVLCAPLPDWRIVDSEEGGADPKGDSAQTFGCVLRIRDLNPLHRIFTALKRVANLATDTESTENALLQSVHDMRYDSARLYRVDPHNADLLVSVRSLGMPAEFADGINAGAYRMARSDRECDETWWCIENAEPLLYKWDPKLPAGLGEPNMHGLTVFNVEAPAFTKKSWKKPGDFWIDLPLLAPNRVIGKLTIDCGMDFKCDLRAEDFELLNLFSALLGALLDALDRKEKWTQDAADKAMATCAHTIRTKLAGLSGFARRYSEAAQGNSVVEHWNTIHQSAVDGSHKAVDRIVHIFGKEIRLEREVVHLSSFFKAILERAELLRSNTQMRCPGLLCASTLSANLDGDALQTALEEMISNSRAMIEPEKQLEVQIEAISEHRGHSEFLRIVVRDNGPGIDDGRVKKVFSPLYSHRPNGQPSTGLGLNYVRRIVEAHGGSITVRKEAGWGAVFVMEIPT